ncbi:hypothetical protein [Flavobacterium sp. XGLA_31]|uniref:hypothetical protein n=1 Tax=Flavobacterium sp. XGLA_31 TaxID=3447666 RepID=UPI003F2A605F
MTEEQSKEIFEYLQKQLYENGFAEIDEQILVRWQESEMELDQFSQNQFLRFYLNQIINIFKSYSNDKVIENSISRINKILDSDNHIEDISLEYFEGKEKLEFDLKKLPSYQEQISIFTNISNQLFPQ